MERNDLCVRKSHIAPEMGQTLTQHALTYKSLLISQARDAAFLSPIAQTIFFDSSVCRLRKTIEEKRKRGNSAFQFTLRGCSLSLRERDFFVLSSRNEMRVGEFP